MSDFLRKAYFIEEVIIGGIMRLVDERVNEILREGELSVPYLNICGLPGGAAVNVTQWRNRAFLSRLCGWPFTLRVIAAQKRAA
jgi:hypothetical protein